MRAIEDDELMLISGGSRLPKSENDDPDPLISGSSSDGGTHSSELTDQGGGGGSYPRALDYEPPSRVDNAIGGAVLGLAGYVFGNGPGAAAGIGAASKFGGEIGQTITHLPDAGRVFIETEMDRALTFHSSAFGR